MTCKLHKAYESYIAGLNFCRTPLVGLNLLCGIGPQGNGVKLVSGQNTESSK